VKPISELAGRPLEWRQTHAFRNEFDLVDEQEIVATLRWVKSFGSLAIGEAADGRWTFKRIGFLRPRVTVRREGEEADVALFEPGWWANGVLNLDRGRKLLWRHRDFWHHQWAFLTESEFPVIQFQSTHKIFKSGATVEIPPGHADPDDLSLLVCLGWYLMVLTAHDAAAAAAGTAGGAS